MKKCAVITTLILGLCPMALHAGGKSTGGIGTVIWLDPVVVNDGVVSFGKPMPQNGEPVLPLTRTPTPQALTPAPQTVTPAPQTVTPAPQTLATDLPIPQTPQSSPTQTVSAQAPQSATPVDQNQTGGTQTGSRVALAQPPLGARSSNASGGGIVQMYLQSLDQ